MEKGPEKLSVEEFLSQEMGRARSFGELYDFINRIETSGHLGKGFNADVINEAIERIAQKNERKEEIQDADFGAIPADYGIRDAVMRLLIKHQAVEEDAA